ncbi:MAG: hypothetical protein ACXABY_00835 [Candidatus Thorarchaeota archaeon]|jgi:threonine aldolase
MTMLESGIPTCECPMCSFAEAVALARHNVIEKAKLWRKRYRDPTLSVGMQSSQLAEAVEELAKLERARMKAAMTREGVDG